MQGSQGAKSLKETFYNQTKAYEMEMLRGHKDKGLETSSKAVEISSSRLQFDARMAELSHAMQDRRLALDEKQIQRSSKREILLATIAKDKT